jgi:hypothetical protein
MVADIARITYDPTRQYRSLIYQQGRVTLEADNNEAAILASEALRLETLDIIGPTGAIGDGFKFYIDANSAGLRKGIFYLGGWRLQLDSDLLLPTAQHEYGDAVNRLIVLLVTEQSVSAVEDQALREVALGGPDSAARTRLMLNLLPIRIEGDSCASGWENVVSGLKSKGVTVDSGLQLHSTARLKAGFETGPATKDPCTPTAAGGYLGADNQMVRVTVTSFTPGSGQKGGSGTLLWGWNNASLLYRATATNPTTLNLTTLPVDQEHAPQAGQWVEVLLTELDLLHGDYIAQGQGFVTWVTSGYVAAGEPVTLNDPLPVDYQNSKTPLFLRLWQAQVKFNDGEATPLDDVSGINVTIDMNILPATDDNGLPLAAARPFWRFSVRPSTPTSIYPERYALAPQPPDGPRQWVTDIAVVLQSQGTILDCRVPWPKADANCCCGITLDPAGVAALGGLQAVVDSLAGSPAVLSLRAGIYQLKAPLTLTDKNTGLIIEGCSQGVMIEALAATNVDGAPDLSAFALGLVVLQGVNRVILRQLAFNIPEVGGVPITSGNILQNVSIIFGIRIDSSETITIEDCILRGEARSEDTFGILVAALGSTRQITLRNNQFIATGNSLNTAALMVIGSGAQDSPAVDLWEITDNEFGGLGLVSFCIAQLGLINCSRNIVRDCNGGFQFYDVDLTSANGFTAYAMKQSAAGENVQLGNAAYSALRPDFLVDTINKFSPIFTKLTPTKSVKLSAVATRALKQQASSSGLNVYNTMIAANTVVAGAANAEKAADVAPPKAFQVDPKTFDQLNKASVTAEAYEQDITPALRFDDNEITLTGASPAAGIALGMSFDELGSVMVTGNRVVVPDATTSPCTLIGPFAAVVTGNMFWQKAVQPDGQTGQFALILLAGSTGIMASGNVTVFAELIAPARPAQASTATWDFLNTVAV